MCEFITLNKTYAILGQYIFIIRTFLHFYGSKKRNAYFFLTILAEGSDPHVAWACTNISYDDSRLCRLIYISPICRPSAISIKCSTFDVSFAVMLRNMNFSLQTTRKHTVYTDHILEMYKLYIRPRL